MENPIKMDDLGIPLFLETPTWLGWNKDLLGMTNIPQFMFLQWKEKGPVFVV